MNFREIVMSRYATKSFDGNTVSDEQIDELTELIRHAPTSFNVQPWKVKLVRDNETKKQLQAASWNQPQIASCSRLFVFCANTDLHGLVDRLDSQLTEAGWPAATVDGFVGMIRKFIGGLDATARLSWAQRQVYIALANGINTPQQPSPTDGSSKRELSERTDGALPRSLRYPARTSLLRVGTWGARI